MLSQTPLASTEFSADRLKSLFAPDGFSRASHHTELKSVGVIGGVDENLAVNLEVDAGEAALFAYRIAHASHPNQTDDRRIGLAIRYIPPDTRQAYSDEDSAALVRGVDRFENFKLEPEPRYDLDPVAVEFHRESEEVRRKIMYRGTDWNTHRT